MGIDLGIDLTGQVYYVVSILDYIGLFFYLYNFDARDLFVLRLKCKIGNPCSISIVYKDDSPPLEDDFESWLSSVLYSLISVQVRVSTPARKTQNKTRQITHNNNLHTRVLCYVIIGARDEMIISPRNVMDMVFTRVDVKLMDV